MKYVIIINDNETTVHTAKEVAQLISGVRANVWVYYHTRHACVGFLFFRDGKVSDFTSCDVPQTHFIKEELAKLELTHA